jgi:hypothetical protein
VLTIVLAGACTGNDETPPTSEGLSGSCGLPTPDPIEEREDDLIPKALIPDGAEIAKSAAERGGFITAINVPLGVQAAFDFYRKAVDEAGYESISVDNEGFEAELYLRRKDRLAAIQIRTSTCEDRSIVFVNEIIPDEP